jgi:hypothetical protein
MYRLIILFFSCIPFCSQGQQFAYEFWHEGRAVLESNDTIKGSIKYDLQNDLLQVKVNNQQESFTARKILFFEIFDLTVKRYRQFYSLPYSPNNTYKVPVFFELLCEGKITLLNRERLEYRTVNTYYYYFTNGPFMVDHYFLLKPDGKIEGFEGRKADWLSLMDNKEKEIREFVKENRFNFDDKYELIKIVEYYNSLFLKK